MKYKHTILILLFILMSSIPAWAGLTQTQVSELYVSIFNRASEGEGNIYWQSQPDMAAAATAMLATLAAQNYFGTSLNSNHAFIEHIYLNTLNKEYWDDPIGITYWVNLLDNGKSRGEVVAELVSVIGDYAPGGPYYDPDDQATVMAYNQFNNRVAVSSYMAEVVDTPPEGWETITQLGSASLNVTDEVNSVNLAKQFIDTLISDDNNNDNPVITVGERENIAAQYISPTGDIIVVNQPGNPLHGMEIIVPPGAYGDTRQFQVSSAPVLSHSFGELFEPLTPMITVENGGDHSEETMTVQIPVQVPQGWFAAAFYFDRVQGKLEPMQLISTEDDVVTVNTRHFSDFIVTGIPQSILDNYLIEGIRSDFYPGVDDFSFINRGSYIAPGGHCAGQSIGAMWYYSAKPEGNQPLWGSYDNNFSARATPDLWEDDSYAYRFCSVLQKDIDWDSFSMDFWLEAQGRVWKLVNNQWEQVEVPAIGPEGTRNLFALAVLLTGEPQFVGIYSDAGGGHAMIVYAVTRDAMHIADPNYPGDINRTIYFSNGTFDPYASGDNWEEINAGRGKRYETILYLAKSTLMPFENISRRWQEVKDGTIGNDLFPAYDMKYLNEDSGQYELLGENQVFSESPVKIKPSLHGQVNTGWKVYRDGERLTLDDGKINLIPGDNYLGFTTFGALEDSWEYIDFQYINVIYEPAEAMVPINISRSFEMPFGPFPSSTDEDANVQFTVSITGRLEGAQNPYVEYYDVNAPAPYDYSGKSMRVKDVKQSETTVVSGTVNVSASRFSGSPVSWNGRGRTEYTLSNPRLVRYDPSSEEIVEEYPDMNFRWEMPATDSALAPFFNNEIRLEFWLDSKYYYAEDSDSPMVLKSEYHGQELVFKFKISLTKDRPEWDDSPAGP
jgi:hypothetical protein